MDYSQISAYVARLIRESTPEYTVWNIEKVRQGKKGSWNYIDGCMLTALTAMASITGDRAYSDFVEHFVRHYVAEDGTILGYQEAEYNLDNINEGRVLFRLHETTGDPRYRLAAEGLKGQLERQPRTPEGNFWHKAIYPNQVWLDGIYMAQVFSALYAKHFGGGDYRDVVEQIENVERHMRDSSTGLYFHGYDASRSVFWANPETGCSKNFWLRSIGWFAVAMADLMEIIPEDQAGRLPEIFRQLMESIAAFADPETGMYCQVPDQPGREGNYLETSGSCMIAYAMLKGARLGLLEPRFRELGQKTFDGTVNKYLSFREGELQLGGICLVAGLGPANNPRRDGSFEYYISEPIVENDAKGVAPFILCYTEVLQAHQ